MAITRLSLNPGDSKTGLAIPFSESTYQNGFTFTQDCTISLTAHLAHIYISAPGLGIKIPSETQRTFAVQAGVNYDVLATSGEGTGGTGAGGTIDYVVS